MSFNKYLAYRIKYIYNYVRIKEAWENGGKYKGRNLWPGKNRQVRTPLIENYASSAFFVVNNDDESFTAGVNGEEMLTIYPDDTIKLEVKYCDATTKIFLWGALKIYPYMDYYMKVKTKDGGSVYADYSKGVVMKNVPSDSAYRLDYMASEYQEGHRQIINRKKLGEIFKTYKATLDELIAQGKVYSIACEYGADEPKPANGFLRGISLDGVIEACKEPHNNQEFLNNLFRHIECRYTIDFKDIINNNKIVSFPKQDAPFSRKITAMFRHMVACEHWEEISSIEPANGNLPHNMFRYKKPHLVWCPFSLCSYKYAQADDHSN